mmetsp:Transcript_1145/g.3195  ORF Transcript_1145/g.3195 Transcript_1145/m.3195 type:complete len:314 (+) Transcript_1145:261-1202(+)
MRPGPQLQVEELAAHGRQRRPVSRRAGHGLPPAVALGSREAQRSAQVLRHSHRHELHRPAHRIVRSLRRGALAARLGPMPEQAEGQAPRAHRHHAAPRVRALQDRSREGVQQVGPRSGLAPQRVCGTLAQLLQTHCHGLALLAAHGDQLRHARVHVHVRGLLETRRSSRLGPALLGCRLCDALLLLRRLARAPRLRLRLLLRQALLLLLALALCLRRRLHLPGLLFRLEPLVLLEPLPLSLALLLGLGPPSPRRSAALCLLALALRLGQGCLRLLLLLVLAQLLLQVVSVLEKVGLPHVHLAPVKDPDLLAHL